MTYKEKWDYIKNDVYKAVSEGYNNGVPVNGNIEDIGRMIAYKYVLDRMNELDQFYSNPDGT